jgi:hypothetical protein
VLYEYDNKANLKPGAQQNLYRLVTFLNEHPDQAVVIEDIPTARARIPIIQTSRNAVPRRSRTFCAAMGSLASGLLHAVMVRPIRSLRTTPWPAASKIAASRSWSPSIPSRSATRCSESHNLPFGAACHK